MVNHVVGIIGGGQLGSMLAAAAKKINIKIVIFCDDIDSPAKNFADEFVFGSYDDSKKINEFINKVDIVTFEFENIPYQTLKTINKSKKVLPKP
jgi:5-(carboxyamino)imidazole ribonucleotide synthase